MAGENPIKGLYEGLVEISRTDLAGEPVHLHSKYTTVYYCVKLLQATVGLSLLILLSVKFLQFFVGLF